MHDREKIIEIVKNVDKAFFQEKVINGNSIHDNEFAERIADALIANRIHDISEKGIVAVEGEVSNVPENKEKMTNLQWLKSMTVEKFANWFCNNLDRAFICGVQDQYCNTNEEDFIKWLNEKKDIEEK